MFSIERCENSDRNKVNIRRAVHDVMMYTLPKCGIPETSLPHTDDEENVYDPADFSERAGVCILRVALAMRDRWRRIFDSQHKSSGFNTENISLFLEKIAFGCPLNYSNSIQSVVNSSFALCNEIILFFHHEKVDIDFGVVVNTISRFVTNSITIIPFAHVKIEESFDKFGDLTWYAGWISDFIADFATPYGSREDVSELFSEHVKIQWKSLKACFVGELSRSLLKDFLGFLPDHIFEVIALEDTGGSPENFASGLAVPSDHEAREPPKLPAISECGAVEGSEFCGRRSESANVPEQPVQDEKIGNSSEMALEVHLGQLSLGAEEATLESKSQPLGQSSLSAEEASRESESQPLGQSSLGSEEASRESKSEPLGQVSLGAEKASRESQSEPEQKQHRKKKHNKKKRH